MIWYNVEQDMDGEWGALKIGVLSASSFSAIMAKHKKGIWGETALKLATYIAKERITGKHSRPTLKGDQFERGSRLEPIAIKAYEDYTGLVTYSGGIYIDGSIGASPDRLVGKDIMVEVKTRTKKLQQVRLRNLNCDPSAKAQIQGQLLLSGRKYCDFVSYSEEFPEGDNRRLFICRVGVDVEYQMILSRRLDDFEELIESEIKLLEL